MDDLDHHYAELQKACSELVAERIEALAADLKDAVEALRGLTDALDAVDREAERADMPGATAWSSAPAVALRYKRNDARAFLARREAHEVSHD